MQPGEGNGNPLQCSCLKNPRDGGAWWAAVYGVTQSRTRLKRLSSSSPLSECPANPVSASKADYQQSGDLERAPPTASLVTPSRRVEAVPPRPLNTAFLGCASEKGDGWGVCFCFVGVAVWARAAADHEVGGKTAS